MTAAMILATLSLITVQERTGGNFVGFTIPKTIAELPSIAQEEFRGNVADAKVLNGIGNGSDASRLLAKWVNFIDSESEYEEEYFRSQVLSGRRGSFGKWINEIQEKNPGMAIDGRSLDMHQRIKWLYFTSVSGGQFDLYESLNWAELLESEGAIHLGLTAKYVQPYNPVGDTDEIKKMSVFHRNALVSLCMVYKNEPYLQVAALRFQEGFKNVWGKDQVLNLLAGRATEKLGQVPDAIRYYTVAAVGTDEDFRNESLEALERLQ